MPMILAAGGFAFRAGRAALDPGSVASEMIRDSALNVGSALAYIVLMLAFHATLMALVAARLTAQLRHRSRHDGLTGLLDRRAIDEALQAQIQRSRRTGETFSVLMLDLDHFKAINDRFGHAAGDQALKHVAALLREVLREVDSLGRIGGEEFLALMPGAALDAAGPVAERVRERLALSPMVLDGEPVAISASIGMAQWSSPDEDASQLVGRADSALYAAKAQGRDRVVAAGVESDGADDRLVTAAERASAMARAPVTFIMQVTALSSRHATQELRRHGRAPSPGASSRSASGGAS